ncbi:MAG: RDD family protein [Pseudomonadota bacterium]
MVDNVNQVKENTDLIDVSDVDPDLEPEENTPAEEVSAETSLEMISKEEEKSAGGFLLAPLKDRLAAFIIDAIVLFVLYWPLLLAYRFIVFGAPLGPIPTLGMHALIFHGIFLLLAFVYFFLLEGVLFASVGKLICHLAVRDASGNQATISGVFWRNLLRIIDLILCALALGFVIMEKTGWHQRLGDFAGQTVVIKKLGKPSRQYALTMDMLASASGRLGAMIIDLILFGAFLASYALLLNPDEPLASMILVVLLPVFMILFFALQEGLTGTTVGKLLFGYTICLEQGPGVDFSSALMRTIARVLDTNFFGFLSILISVRKQRLGDLLAGTLVIKIPRQLKGLIGAVITLVVIAMLFFAGQENRNNYLSSSFRINFLPALSYHTGGVSKLGGTTTKSLSISNFEFAVNDPNQIRKPAVFKQGEEVYLVFDVIGYEIEGGKAWVQEDLQVRYPDNSIGLKLENVIDYYDLANEGKPVQLTNNIILPKNALLGRYTVTVTLRDKHSDRQLKEQRFFYVNDGKSTIAPIKPEPAPAEQPIEKPEEKPEEKPAGPRTIVNP